jgi:DNA polymerase-3 subunit alpha
MILVISDGTASQEVTVYSEVFDQHRELVREDAVLLIEAKVRTFRRSGDDGDTIAMRVAAERIYDVAGARARFSRGLKLSMNGEANAAKLKQLLSPYRNGPCPVNIEYRNGDATVDMWLGEEWRVTPDEKLVKSLNEWLKPDNVRFVYP